MTTTCTLKMKKKSATEIKKKEEEAFARSCIKRMESWK